MWGGWSAPPSMPWAGSAPPAAGAPPPPPPPAGGADLFGADDGIDWDDAAFAQIDAAVAAHNQENSGPQAAPASTWWALAVWF